MKVLITDCDYKHSIALQCHIRDALPDVHLVGHSPQSIRYARYYRYCQTYIASTPLADVVRARDIDMVIPVGAKSVQTVREVVPDKAVLPLEHHLRICYDKSEATALAASVGVAVPRTVRLRHPSDVAEVDIAFPCVVKPANEVEGQFVRYPRDRAELQTAVAEGLRQIGPESSGVLVQEYVAGAGAGFFGLYQRGSLVRLFMHRRIREWPSTGGVSTAARAIRDPALLRSGKAILDALQWHGVAMVEFKYRPDAGDYVFIELNGKFWGSAELALSAGVNFGADLIRVYRGEILEYNDQYDDEREFYWPLDGDLLALWCRREVGWIREYCRSVARTNLGQSLRADAIKTVGTAVKLVRLVAER
jgi:predicted ATP-grasp superfamily ATP-dependent carboligase